MACPKQPQYWAWIDQQLMVLQERVQAIRSRAEESDRALRESKEEAAGLRAETDSLNAQLSQRQQCLSEQMGIVEQIGGAVDRLAESEQLLKVSQVCTTPVCGHLESRC